MIEVLAALVLLASAGVTILKVQSRCVATMAETRDRSTAAMLAEELIARWRVNETNTHSAAGGVFASREGWSWRRLSRPRIERGLRPLVEVTLTILRERADGRRIVESFVWLEHRETTDDR